MSDVQQATGRILRICEDALPLVVVDIVDTVWEDCRRWFERCKKFYAGTVGAEIELAAKVVDTTPEQEEPKRKKKKRKKGKKNGTVRKQS